MAGAGVTSVLSKLEEVASAEATALLRVDDQIRELRRRLVYLQAFVRGADQQRRGRASELLLLWARETREVAFEVEDAVDEFHLKVEAFHVKLKWDQSWYHWALKLLNGLAMQIMTRHGLSREITKINGRIKEISEIKETYKIESSSSEIWSASSMDPADVDWPEGKLRLQSLDLKGNLHKWFYLYINMAASGEKSVCFTWDRLFKNHNIPFVQLVQLHEHHRTSAIISILPAPATCAGLLCHFLMVKAQTARLSRLNAPSVC